MFQQNEINALIRSTFIFLSVVLFVSGFFAWNPLGDYLSTILSIIFAFVAASPFEHYIEDAFRTRPPASVEIREKLKKEWIDKHLRAEEKFVGWESTTNTGQNGRERFETQFGIDLTLENLSSENKPYTLFPSLTRYLNLEQDDFSKYQFENGDEPSGQCEKSVKITPIENGDESSGQCEKSVKITPKDTLRTIFDQFNDIVKDDEDVTGEYIVVLGERGARKIIQLLRLAEHLEPRDIRVPVFLNLFSWAAGCKPIEIWLQDEISYQYDISRRRVRKLIEDNYLILLLNGFDEISSNHRRQFIEALKSFLASRLADPQNGSTWKDWGMAGNLAETATSARPIDLRDSVVIASQLPRSPHPYAKVIEAAEIKDPKKALDKWSESTTLDEAMKVFCKDPCENAPCENAPWEKYKSQLETDSNSMDIPNLALHLRELVETLQGLGKPDQDAPVVVTRIRPLGREQMSNFMLSHFKDLRHEALAASNSATHTQLRQTDDHEMRRVIKGYLETDIVKDAFSKNPFLLGAFVSQFHYDMHAETPPRLYQRIRLFISHFPYDLPAVKPVDRFELRDPEIKAHIVICKKFHDLLKNLEPQDQQVAKQMLEVSLRRTIVKQYVEMRLRQQSDNLGPYSDVLRRDLLKSIAQHMNERQRRVVNEDDVVFYLEDFGKDRIIFKDVKLSKQYSGFVAALTTVFFVVFYVIFIRVIDLLPAMLSEISNISSETFMGSTMLLVGVFVALLGRYFGWASCGQRDPNEKNNTSRNRPSAAAQWHANAGLSAAIFMSLITGIIFFEISEIVYGGVNADPLRYEAVVVGIFSFALFFLTGGLDLGRRYPVIAHSEDGRRFLLVSTIIATIIWTFFFFFFLFWPRTRFEVLTEPEIRELISISFVYSVVTGIFLGLLSGLIFSHLYLRYIFLEIFLRYSQKMDVKYSQILQGSARSDIGLLRQIGGGYLFRHQYILEYFASQEEPAQ